MLGLPQDQVQLLRLWYHENCRVFRDRLVNEEDRSWFDQLLKRCMEQWEVTFNKVCPFQPILYGDFMSPGSDVKSYELITSESKVRGPGRRPTPGGIFFNLPPWGPGPLQSPLTDHHTVTRGPGFGMRRPAPGDSQHALAFSGYQFLCLSLRTSLWSS